jgi:hypothetical protein
MNGFIWNLVPPPPGLPPFDITKVFFSSFQSSFSLTHENYRTFYFDDICKGDNSKFEINLKSWAAIFQFKEDNLRIRKLFIETEISCHIEVETLAGTYGLLLLCRG